MSRNVHIAGLASALALAVAAAAAASTPATLRFMTVSPVKVSGTHFRASETVKVTLYAGTAKRIRTTHATTRGSFLVEFGTLPSQDRCGASISVTALGARGTKAFYKLPQLECPVQPAGANP